jgi:hypothetical protein
MDCTEFLEWQVFYNLEPWGFNIENLRWDMLYVMYGNVHRDTKKQKNPFTAKDFLPTEFGGEEPKKAQELTPEQRKNGQMFLAGLLKTLHGGKVVNEDGSECSQLTGPESGANG